MSRSDTVYEGNIRFFVNLIGELTCIIEFSSIALIIASVAVDAAIVVASILLVITLLLFPTTNRKSVSSVLIKLEYNNPLSNSPPMHISPTTTLFKFAVFVVALKIGVCDPSYPGSYILPTSHPSTPPVRFQLTVA
jgi:hypothetical protein